MVTVVSFVQFLNICQLTVRTLAGSLTLVRLGQFIKVQPPKTVRESGRETVCNAVQP